MSIHWVTWHFSYFSPFLKIFLNFLQFFSSFLSFFVNYREYPETRRYLRNFGDISGLWLFHSFRFCDKDRAISRSFVGQIEPNNDENDGITQPVIFTKIFFFASLGFVLILSYLILSYLVGSRRSEIQPASSSFCFLPFNHHHPLPCSSLVPISECLWLGICSICCRLV